MHRSARCARSTSSGTVPRLSHSKGAIDPLRTPDSLGCTKPPSALQIRSAFRAGRITTERTTKWRTRQLTAPSITPMHRFGN
uniref:Uncharacterized protein n=1 Tax=Globisporangium ultimum (strain ATCC 200006 / CBS 805.95 / DAOM BR144) TaxID=431595 RepID=K3WPA2_GLOUD